MLQLLTLGRLRLNDDTRQLLAGRRKVLALLLAMYRGRYREAVTLLQEAVALSANESSTLTAARNRWILASAYLALGDIAHGGAELDLAETVLGEKETAPIYLFYLAALQLDAGNVRSAKGLQSRVERTARVQNPTDRTVRALLRARMALRGRQPHSAIAILRAIDGTSLATLRDALLAESYSVLGIPDSAIAAAKRVESHWQFGFETQPTWRHAGFRLAKLSLAAGDTAQARAALGRQLVAWKDADAEFPDLVTTRRLLAELTDSR